MSDIHLEWVGPEPSWDHVPEHARREFARRAVEAASRRAAEHGTIPPETLPCRPEGEGGPRA